MARTYFKEDVTVLSFDGVTALLTEIGSGTLTVEGTEVENSALMDSWTDATLTKSKATFEGELAADSTNWWTKYGDEGTLTFTKGANTVTGTFQCVKVSEVMGDAMRFNVTLNSRGTVTLS